MEGPVRKVKCDFSYRMLRPDELWNQEHAAGAGLEITK
jgi:hypothetical protein